MNKTKGHLSQYQIRVDYQVHRIMSFSARVIRFCGLLHENNKNPKEVSLFVRLQGADLEMEGKQSVIFVFEECNGGTLEDKIKKEPMMNKASIFKYILQIVEGLNDLRKKGILHRNLLPCNIMLHED